MKYSESIARGRSEKLEFYLRVLYVLLRDLLIIRASGGEIRNADMRPELESLAKKISAEWIGAAVKQIDELVELLRRNIQKTIALDALILELRGL